jgi:hypothetical protein
MRIFFYYLEGNLFTLIYLLNFDKMIILRASLMTLKLNFNTPCSMPVPVLTSTNNASCEVILEVVEDEQMSYSNY